MNKQIIHTLFRDCRSVVSSDGMQIVRQTGTKDHFTELLEDHSLELLIGLLFSTDGLVSQAGSSNKQIPARWHIEYRDGNWFKETVDERPAKTDWNPSQKAVVEFLTECRLIVDEWKDA